MATISDLYDSFAPNTTEFKRVIFDIEKGKYYKPHKSSVLLATGIGEVVSEGLGKEQKKVKMQLKSRIEEQMQFEIMTHDARLTQQTTFVTGSLPTGSKGSSGTYTVADGSILRAGDVIKNMTTGEYLFVSAVDTTTSPDQITAYPGFQQTGFSGLTAFPWTLSDASPTTKSNLDVIRIVGNAFQQGSYAGDIIDSRPTTAVNYMQIFREEFGIKLEESKIRKNGRMDLADKEERAKADFLIKLEKAIIEGAINQDTVSVDSVSGKVFTMQGIRGTVSTYNQAITALTGGGTEWTIPKLEQVLAQISDASTTGKVIALCGQNALRKFRELLENKVQINVQIGQEDFGIKPFRYESQFLTVDFVRHEIFDASGNSDDILFFDPGNYDLVHLKDCEMKLASQHKGLPYGGLSANDRLAIQDAWHGVYSLDYRFEESSALVTGATYTIGS